MTANETLRNNPYENMWQVYLEYMEIWRKQTCQASAAAVRAHATFPQEMSCRNDENDDPDNDTLLIPDPIFGLVFHQTGAPGVPTFLARVRERMQHG